MNLLIVGPPGAGKGTQAKVLARKLGVTHLATGDILRHEVRQGSELGRKARDFMEAGQLVPDDLIIAMMLPMLKRESDESGFILDGFPRTLVQMKEFQDELQKTGIRIHAVISVQVRHDVLVSRLADRRTCTKSGCNATFHLVNNPPRISGRCDDCGTALITRKDDRRDVVEDRLKVYNELTDPVIRAYEELRLVMTIDGEAPIGEVTTVIAAKLQGKSTIGETVKV